MSAAVVSNIIAGVALAATIALGIWSNRRNAENERRQEALVESMQATHAKHAELTELLAKQAVDDSAATGVTWTAEHFKKNTWLLRNLGGETAVGARIDTDALGGVRTDVTPTLPADVTPGDGITIRAFGAWGAPVADLVKVSWGDGQQATVTLPRWL